MIKYVSIPVPRDIYFQLKNKCTFYDIPVKDILTDLIVRFIDGEFDNDFDIPKE